MRTTPPAVPAAPLPPRRRWIPALAALALGACADLLPGDGDARIDPTLALAAGEEHACLLDPEGAAWCWGANESGQLGNGSLVPSATPVRVAGGRRFVAIQAGGSHTCALTAGGEAFCWGSNRFGQLGSGGASTAEFEPVPVTGGLSFAALSVGGFHHTCGRTAAGELHCWGGDRDGQLGYAPPDECLFGVGIDPCGRTPRPVPLGSAVGEVSAGFLHTCALDPAGVARCWGENSAGQLGTGTTGTRVPPSEVRGAVRFAALASGSLHGCGLDEAGRAHCWGEGSAGALGTGTPVSTLTPAAVSGGLSYRTLAVSRGNTSFGHGCGIATDGRLHCWGANHAGQLGSGATDVTCPGRAGPVACAPAPRAVGEGGWSAVAAGTHFTCAADAEGTPFCWGANAAGQLGNGSGAASSVPVRVAGGVRLPRPR